MGLRGSKSFASSGTGVVKKGPEFPNGGALDLGKTRLRDLDPFSPPVLYLGRLGLHFLGIYAYVLLRDDSASGVGGYGQLPLGLEWNDIHIALLMLGLYSVCWFFGYRIAGRKLRGRSLVRKQARGMRASPTVLVPVFVLALVLIAIMFQMHPERGFAEASGRSYLTEGLYGSIFFAVVFGTSALYAFMAATLLEREAGVRDAGRMSRLNSTIMLLAICGVAWFGVLWQLGGRSRAAEALIALLIVGHYCVRRVSLGQVALVVGALLFAVTLHHSVTSPASEGLSVGGSVDYLFNYDEGGRQFVGLYTLAATVEEFRHGDEKYYWGSTWVASILSEFGLEEGRSSRDVMMLDVLGLRGYGAGVPITKPGDLYINFGPLGMLGAVGVGYLSRKAYWYLIEGRALGVVSVPLYIAAMLQLGLPTAGGYLTEGLVRTAVYALALVALWIYLGGAYRLERYRVS